MKYYNIMIHISKGLFVKDLGSNLYLFQFYHEVDMQRILEGGPCSFDNNLLIIGKLTAGDRPSTVPLLHVPMWVQIYASKLPMRVGLEMRNIESQQAIEFNVDPKNVYALAGPGS